MADSSRASARKTVQVALERDELREIISGLARPGEQQEWCIACGAGRGTNPLDKLDWVQDVTRDVLQGKSFEEFLRGLKDFGDQAWCIACGAGKDASPFDKLANPVNISDAMIDQLAERLIGAFRIG